MHSILMHLKPNFFYWAGGLTVPHCRRGRVEQSVHVVQKLLEPIVGRLRAAHRSGRNLLYLADRLSKRFH